MFLGERRSLQRRYRKRSDDGDGPESRSAASASASGSVAELEETFSEPASEDEDEDSNDRMPLLRPLRRRSRGSRSGGGSSRGGGSSVGSVGGSRGSGSVGKTKKTRMTTSLPGASPRKLLRLGRGMGRHHHHRRRHGADTDDEDDARQYYEYESDGSDASSAYSPPQGSDNDESFETAEAEAAVQRGERLAGESGDAGRNEREEDDWTEASAAAAASVMALAEAVRRGGGGGSGENEDLMEIAETNIRRRDRILYDETEGVSSLPPPPPSPPLMEEEEESEEAGTSHMSHEASTTDADASLDLEHYHDAPEEEQKEDDPAPPSPPPPPPSPSSPLWDVGQYGETREEDDLVHLMMPSSPSAMNSAQRSKYRKYVATLPAGGVTFADDHSACSVPLAHVQRVAPLPRECYGGGVVRGRKGKPEEEEEKEDADDAGCLEFDNDRGHVEADADTGRAAAVLLISPSTKQFELVRVPLSLFSFSEEQRGQRDGGGGDSGPSSPTCGEVLAKARKRAIFRPLRKQRYTSLCEMPPLQATSSEESSEDMGGGVVVIKSSKKVAAEDASPPAPPPCEMINALRIDTYGIGGESGKGNNSEGDWADEVLVAVPKGLTASQASELARPILSDATMRRLIRERLSAADAAEAKKKRRAALRRRRADRKRQVRAKRASKDRSVSQARPENVSNAKVALKVLLLAALALALGFALTATAFALFGTNESHFIAGAKWPLLAPVVPPAPTPGYGDDNSVEHKDCCRKPAEATSAAQAGGLWFSIAWGTK